MEEGIEAIYSASQRIDNTPEADLEDYSIFEQAAQFPERSVKMLGIQMLFRWMNSCRYEPGPCMFTRSLEFSGTEYFHKFKRQPETQTILYNLLTDPDKNVRMTIIKSLPVICKNGMYVTQVGDVLSQLLNSKDPQELILVRQSLKQVLLDHPQDCTCAIYNTAMQATNVRDRINILLFFEEKLPECVQLKDEMKERIWQGYVTMISEVDSEDSELLLELLLATNFMQAISCLNAIEAKITNDGDVFSQNEILHFLTEQLQKTPARVRSDATFILSLLQLILRMMGNATVDELEEMVSILQSSKLLTEVELETVSAKILGNFTPNSLPFEDADSLFEELQKIFILANIGTGFNPQRQLIADALVRNISNLQTMSQRQKKNYLLYLASFSMKRRHKSDERSLVEPIFAQLWEYFPSKDEFLDEQLLSECLMFPEIEITMFVVENLISCSKKTYEIVEETEKEWRLKMSNMMVVLRQLSAKLSKKIVESKGGSVENKTLYTLNQIGLLIWKFLGNKVDVELTPSWLKNDFPSGAESITASEAKNTDSRQSEHSKSNKIVF